MLIREVLCSAGEKLCRLNYQKGGRARAAFVRQPRARKKCARGPTDFMCAVKSYCSEAHLPGKFSAIEFVWRTELGRGAGGRAPRPGGGQGGGSPPTCKGSA